MPLTLTNEEKTFIARQVRMIQNETGVPLSGDFIVDAYEKMYDNPLMVENPGLAIAETLQAMHYKGMEQLGRTYYGYSKNHNTSVEHMNQVLGLYEGTMRGIYEHFFNKIVNNLKENDVNVPFDDFRYGYAIGKDDPMAYTDPGVEISGAGFFKSMREEQVRNSFKESVENKNIKKTDLIDKINKNKVTKEEACNTYKLLKAKHEKQSRFVQFFSFREKNALAKAKTMLENLRNESNEKGKSFEDFVEKESNKYINDMADNDIKNYVEESKKYTYLREQNTKINRNRSFYTKGVIKEGDLANTREPITNIKEFEEVSYEKTITEYNNEMNEITKSGEEKTDENDKEFQVVSN